MKIAFDAKRAFLNRSGLGNYSRDLIRGLASEFPEHEYTLYTPSDGNGLFELPGSNCTPVSPPAHYGKLRKSYWRSVRLGKQAQHDGQDIFHGLSNELPRNIQKSKINSVVTIHDLIFMRHPEWYPVIDRAIYRKKFRTACQVADKVITVSQQTRDDVVEFFGIPSERVEVIYQCCNQAFYQKHTIEEKEALREELQLPREFLLYVGTIEKRKNLLHIVKALHDEAIDIPLLVLGRPTAYANVVKEYIARHAMDQVVFLENLPFEKFPLLYQMAQALVYPSVFEGFGIPILEALVSGIPVITSQGGCFGEVGGPESLYVDPQKPEEIGYAIKQVIGDSALREQMISAGRKHAEQFDNTLLVNQVMNLYKSLLA